MTNFVEPILTPNPKRFVIYPIQHDGIWTEFKRQEASFWTAEEIDLSQDMIDWQKLSDDERHFIKTCSCFFRCKRWNCKRKSLL